MDSAVVEGENPLSRLRRQLSRGGEPLAEPASFVHTGQRQKKSADKPINFSPLPKPPPSGEVARRSRDGEGCSQDESSQSPTATALPKGEPLAEPASFVHTGQRQKKSADKPINFSPLPKPPPSGEVARRSRDGEGCSQDESSQSPTATALPKGEPLAEPASFVHTGQRQKKSADKRKTLCPCQSLSLSGEVARRSRDGEGLLPERTLSVSLRSTALPKGRALGREGRFRPYGSTAEEVS